MRPPVYELEHLPSAMAADWQDARDSIFQNGEKYLGLDVQTQDIDDIEQNDNDPDGRANNVLKEEMRYLRRQITILERSMTQEQKHIESRRQEVLKPLYKIALEYQAVESSITFGLVKGEYDHQEYQSRLVRAAEDHKAAQEIAVAAMREPLLELERELESDKKRLEGYKTLKMSTKKAKEDVVHRYFQSVKKWIGI
ncbi:hypothetical protein KCU65_g8827, partial [Aureobasidium melanogenum]